MNWPALGQEAVDLLRRYLMLDTTNPPGNETVGARFLEEVLAREGIASETVESAPGRGNDERISLENLQEGARCHTEMLLDVAAA